jgi:8-oxo-dGTP diphosphatase
MIVKVGVGVIILNNRNQVLLGKRKSNHGLGTWSFPGGHLEYKEHPFECAIRETKEETGLIISDLKAGPWLNDVFENDRHYITILVQTCNYKGIPQVMEPDKCERWDWFDWAQLPQPLFKPIATLLAQESKFIQLLDKNV